MKSIMFFSRGRGWGHAIRDMIIIDAVKEKLPEVRFEVFSYDQGYEAFSFYGRECTNISPPEWPPSDGPEWFGKLAALIEERPEPDLVVSDELGIGATFAKEFGVPSILISDWLPIKPYVSDDGFRSFYSADRIIYLGYENSMHPPEEMRDKISFIGPIIRKSEYSQKDRLRIRAELQIEPETKFILVLAGAVSEADESYFRACIDGFKHLEIDTKLCIIAGRFFEKLQQEANGSIEVIEYIKDPNRLIIASSLVIGRGGHTTMWELAWLITPSIIVPLPESINVLQGIHANEMKQQGFITHVIPESEFSPAALAQTIERILNSEEKEREKIQATLNRYDIGRGEDKARDIILSML